MDNSTAHSTTPITPVSASYVDAYMPPASTPQVSAADTATQSNNVTPSSISYAPPASNASVPTPPLGPEPVIQSLDLPIASQPSSTQDTKTPVPTVSSSAEQSNNSSEELEDQNIFMMLGVSDGTPEQRETFLDELQQVIWEDFLEYDVKLLTTKEEQVELEKMISSTGVSELEKQEKIVVYLEKLIPDLEEIMLEKALELKEEMVRERVKSMREFFTDKPEVLAKIDSAEEMMNGGKWRSAVALLNSLS